jgi:hypothetical protein
MGGCVPGECVWGVGVMGVVRRTVPARKRVRTHTNGQSGRVAREKQTN